MHGGALLFAQGMLSRKGGDKRGTGAIGAKAHINNNPHSHGNNPHSRGAEAPLFDGCAGGS
jgi:hypothetical protein